ncbi:hypothetical protein [Microlunatus sp. Gsoil 973]|jgi:hypothetical protein|uniref:hypothetical protein n=1 Tax=Microlunatus sp. Gsoil 973 TaxID=2672569 RepID=UPI0012B4BAE8|nr:hypothetical protein [Microlunatus sp. Gsoil 973]QGN34055.1 hypothetical protein GJV80_15915 [Microlunatus sp. Gsoil 973]
MLFNIEALSPHLSTSTYDRSLEAAREYQLRTALSRQREDLRSQKRTEPWRWFAARRVA